MRYGTILSTGRYIPDIEVSNATFKEWMGKVSPALPGVVDKFEESSGILTRWYAPRAWATSDLAVRAAQDALERAGIRPEQLDMILLGTDSPDYITPATSVVVQYKLGAVNAGTYDLGCACASFPTGVASACGLIAANPWMKYILVIGAYMMSKLADPNDITSFFYGDGAGAAVIGVSDKPGFVSSTFLADGSYHAHWGIYSGGTFEPASVESVQAGRTKVRLVQRYPPEVNHEGWPKIVRGLAEKGNFSLDDVAMVIFTQVRKPSIDLVMETLGMPISKAHWVMDKWGYMGSACIPVCLDDAIRLGKIKSGDLVLLVGSGVGYNQAGAALVMP